MNARIRRTQTGILGTFVLVSALLVAGCGRNETADPQSESARPVIYTVAAAAAVTETGFSGTIEPRYATDMAFRVLGRIVSRPVMVGDRVHKGQEMAALDPTQLDLAVQSAQADLRTAQAQYDNAVANEKRQAILLKGNNVAQADYDAARQARDTSAAGVDKARASLKKAEDQRGYAVLRPDYDGVVSATQAEIGQVVAAGQTVVTIARPDVREAVVDIPDHLTQYLAVGTRFQVTLEADPTVTGQGQVREVSPQADARTRSRRVKLTLSQPPQGFRLGAMIKAQPAVTPTERAVRLPLSALVDTDGQTSVYVIDPQSRIVSRQVVTVDARDERSFITSGVAAGSYVAIAGVHALKEGQIVMLNEKGSAL
ncbi:multidrug resistance protein MdtE [Brucella sp. NBRC 12953]|uniref:efflux RND transporter periplasmic adaptor subunit n=1 Tax=Brucella sp. NBRC 12953 TaxID=3075481 RepID=UPI0030B4D341